MGDSEYVIVVDDDPSIQAIIGRSLGLSVVPFHSLEGFLSHSSRYYPKAIFLDILLAPETNGLDVVPRVKAMWPYSALLVMTSASSEKWIADALEAGADDFLTKPLNSEEVRARMNVRARVLESLRNVDEVVFGELKFSERHCMLEHSGKKIYLSPVASTLMKIFCVNSSAVVSRETLHRVGWPSIKVSENALDQRILELRRALVELSSEVTIHCVHGEGYIFSSRKPERKRTSRSKEVS